MSNWSIIVLVLCFLFAAFLIWKETKRVNRARIIWRLIASTFAIISLACIGLPINYDKAVTVDEGKNIVLLTSGFNEQEVNSFLKVDPGTPIYTLDNSIIASAKFSAAFISDVSTLFQNQDIHTIHVFGNGLNMHELRDLNKLPIVFHAPKPNTGINSIFWQRRLTVGEKLYVQGSFNNTSSSTLKLILKSFNTTVDSIKLLPKQSQKFQLTTVPKAIGRSLYTLLVLNGKDTLFKEPVPFEVEQGNPIKVLILASAPDFENKFLKNWLGKKKFKTVSRTLISKNKYTKDFLNTDVTNIDRISASTLTEFNIILADATELASISKAELSAIRGFVSNGNGLIIKAADKSINAFYSNFFPVENLSSGIQQVRLQLSDTTTTLQALGVKDPVVIRNQNITQPIITDKQNRTFVSSVLYGSGKVLFTTITNTFSWLLAGNEQDYATYWSEILNKASGKKIENEQWSVAPFLPRVNHPSTITIDTDDATLPSAQIAGTSVYLQNNPLISTNWSGTYWPLKAGWQPTIQLNGSTFWWYAFDADDWKSVEAADRIEKTKQYAAANSTPTRAIDKKIEKTVQTEIPKIYFFLLFIVCCGYLWLENKISL